MTHTPGPWVKISQDRLWNEIVSSTNHQIVLVQNNSAFGKVPADETEGNAALIATAPELLEACRHALRTLEHAHSVADDWYASANSGIQEALNDMLPGEDDHCATSKLRAAISKAEGKQ